MSSHRSLRARAPKTTSRSTRLLRCEQLESRIVLAASSPLDLQLLASLSGAYASICGKTAAVTPPTVAKAAAANLNGSGTTASLSVLGSDAQGESSLVYDWTITSMPAGGSATFSVNGTNAAKNDTVTFNEAGAYGITATIVDKSGLTVASSLKVNVGQTLTSILVTPGTASILVGATQQFSAQGLDQFQRPMAAQPKLSWMASGGTISSAGLFTACSTAGNYGVAAYTSAMSGGAKVTVTVPLGALKDPALASLVQKLDADGSLSRADMIQILTSVGASGTVSATDFSDLKTILADAAQYSMPGYVEVLAGDVVNGNAADADYQGAPLGNLAAGSSAAQLNKLIDKWFLGTDLPSLTSSSLTYRTVSGSLFPTTPTHKDEFQGLIDDCYFISLFYLIIATLTIRT
ncbi:MAG: hypothetical protein ACLP9L_26660 [Thermoguttaceae bacterium]